jgi:hypothetical protein
MSLQDVDQRRDVDGRAETRLDSLMRAVNRRIAAASGVDIAALACECNSRACEHAIEVPLRIFDVVSASPRFFVVRPGHEEPLVERIVRRERTYLVVERS